MPAVFSRPSAMPAIPADIYIEIASYLHARDQSTLLSSCWTVHDIIAPILYRRLDLWIQPVTWDTADGLDHSPLRLLATLAVSGRYAKIPGSTRCYARYVHAFAYASYNTHVDLCAVPLMAEFLRFAIRLRHLRVDVVSASIPLVLDQFRRSSIICAPPPSFASMYVTASSISPWILPFLESVRSNKATLVESLMRYRGIRTAIVDGLLATSDMDSLLSMLSPLRWSHLVRLSLSISDPATYQNVLHAASICFPCLEDLSVGTSSRLADKIFNFVLGGHPAGSLVTSKLRGVGVNYAGYGDEYTQTLQDAKQLVADAGERWLSLRMVILGDAMWSRDDDFMPWEFKVGIPPTVWQWLYNVNAGICAPPRRR